MRTTSFARVPVWIQRQEAFRRARKRKHQREADVCLLSYPKSGRTWLRMLIGQAIVRRTGIDTRDATDVFAITRRNESLPTINITHDDDPQDKVPSQIEADKRRYRRKRVLLLVRDPLDVVVSEYFEKSRRRGLTVGTLSEFLRNPPCGGLPSQIRFLNVWAESHNVPADFLLIRYEDLHADAERELARVLSFVGFDDIDAQLLSAAVEASRFERMRSLEAAGGLTADRMRPGSPDDPESFKTRRGRVGGYVDYLAPDEIAWVADLLRSELSSMFGYPAGA